MDQYACLPLRWLQHTQADSARKVITKIRNKKRKNGSGLEGTNRNSRCAKLVICRLGARMDRVGRNGDYLVHALANSAGHTLYSLGRDIREGGVSGHQAVLYAKPHGRHVSIKPPMAAQCGPASGTSTAGILTHTL